jgi:AcrR family transcriptional regulator
MSNLIPETRDRILKATLECLETADGKLVRISDVANAAGLTRQTLHLYFRTRADLLIAVTHYLDDLHSSDERLAKSRTASGGIERLEAYVDAWVSYIPEIFGVARALLLMNDPDADSAWASRMQDMWEGCEAAIRALSTDGNLNPDYSTQEASDLLWTLLSVRNWEQLRHDRGWTQQTYLCHIQKITKTLFVST